MTCRLFSQKIIQSKKKKKKYVRKLLKVCQTNSQKSKDHIKGLIINKKKNKAANNHTKEARSS